ncbi:hypothetical protein K2P56_03225 [Patescibacteria group bacterium]|nr:hypothetical protein [Patescibacteria group bacterium]
MEERVKTSFIPKASLEVERKQSPKGNPVALANVIAGFVLILAILGSAGMFLFERFTIEAISAKQKSLELSRAAFEPATIKELSRLNTRIETGKVLLGEHMAVSKLFDELESLVLASVRFSDFSYSSPAAGKVIMTAKGAAQSFNAVALQSGGFSKSDIITEPIFSNVNIGNTGAIEFDFQAIIDTGRLKYSGGAPASPAVESVPASTTNQPAGGAAGPATTP